MNAFCTLLKVESKLVLRGIDTIFFGVGFPFVVALFMGILMSDTPTFDASFSSISTIGICATGLMGLPLTIADYRHRKILKRYAVTPISPWMILMVQVIINLVIAFVSLALNYALMAVCFGFQFTGSWSLFLISFLVVALSMYAIGLIIASLAPNLKTANLLCTLLYFPMIFLSGTVIPYDIMPVGLQHVMDFLPLTQGIKIMNAAALQGTLTTMLLPISLLLAIGLLGSGIAIKYFRWK